MEDTGQEDTAAGEPDAIDTIDEEDEESVEDEDILEETDVDQDITQEPDLIEEDMIEEDPGDEEPADPCDPNPCTDPPPDECSGNHLMQYSSPGLCTPSGGDYNCEYPPTDVDCTATNDMACIDDVCTNTIQQVRDAADGPVNFVLKKVYVTYVNHSTASSNGFFIQRVQTGPGLYMYLGSISPGVDQGNLVELTIRNVSEFHGRKEVDDFTITANDGISRDVGFLVQDFSTGGTINEDTESELIQINNALVVSGSGSRYRVTYGASDATSIYYTGFSDLTPAVCPRMVMDILAPAGEYDGTYQLTPYADADFLRLDASACSTDDNSNWDFEDWTFSDPPEDFEKATDFFTATDETTGVNNGSHSTNLTWTSMDNQDFYQSWYTPAASGTSYTFHVWVYDNEPGGRARACVTPYDFAMTPLTNDYGPYSSDSAQWAELTNEFTPAAVGFIRAFLRLYDVSSGWDGSATVYVDDWALTVHTAFNVTDGAVDSWTTTDPGTAPLMAGTPGVTMEIYSAVNDEGVLYLATNEVTAGMSDHFLYAWIGEPSSTGPVPVPWAKLGTVASPGPGSYLLVFIQEEFNDYCEVLMWNPSASGWDLVTSSCGSGAGFMEASVNLVTLLGLSGASDLPASAAFAAAPYGTNDGGSLYSTSQIPACTACDANIDSDETARHHRALILVGNVKP